MKPDEAAAVVRICVDDAKENPVAYREINGKEVLCAVVPLDATSALLEGYQAAVRDLTLIESCKVCANDAKCDPTAEIGTKRFETWRKCRDGSITMETNGERTKGLWKWRGPEPGKE